MTSTHPSAQASARQSELALLLRAARRQAGLSQRELATAAGVTRSRVARAEAGGPVPWQVVLDLLAACGLGVQVLEEDGSPFGPGPATGELLRDRARRRDPAHLDPRAPDPFGDRWADRGHQTWADPPRPSCTGDLDRRRGQARGRGPASPRPSWLRLVPPLPQDDQEPG